MSDTNLSNLSSNAYIHMVGIGGISMSALAHMLKYFGYRISGSDRCETEITKKLTAASIDVAIGHSASNITKPDLVCYTAAIPMNNPELVKARSLGIPVMERAELLGQLMKRYQYPIAISGTHGKTTTTSMLSLVLLEAQSDPTILVGGELPQIGGNYKIGSDKYLVFEACEYVESFLHFHPYISVITNIEEDHMDYFADLNHIITAFVSFARLNSPLGCIIVCSDDKNIQSVVQNIDGRIVKYGLFSKNNDFYADNISMTKSQKTHMEVYAYGDHIIDLELSVHGDHNVRNALAAFAAAWEMGVDKEAIKRGLESFGGAKRRFDKLGEYNGISVVDDYSHHPTEIRCALETAKTLAQGDVWCVFQPHTYSRTKAFLNEFAESLSIADKVVLTDIYPAREEYDGSTHSCDLAALIQDVTYINDFGAIKRYVKANTKPGDMVITMGAGDVYEIGYSLVE